MIWFAPAEIEEKGEKKKIKKKKRITTKIIYAGWCWGLSFEGLSLMKIYRPFSCPIVYFVARMLGIAI